MRDKCKHIQSFVKCINIKLYFSTTTKFAFGFKKITFGALAVFFWGGGDKVMH